MSSPVRNSWNITSETIRREHGLSEDCGKSRSDRLGVFNDSCLGSLFVAERMQLSHYLDNGDSGVACMDFKEDRNLICTSSSNRRICVFDWLNDRQIDCFDTKHSGVICSMKFLNTGGNGLDFISACWGGQVRHTCVGPAGNYVSRRIFLNTAQYHRLVTVPGSPLEFIAASSNGGIFLVDLRTDQGTPRPNAIAKTNVYRSFQDISHHPLVPEFCASSYDQFVRVFDKRNLKCPVKEMCPSIKYSDDRHCTDCSYNYNGSEILAYYTYEGAFLFDNKNNKDGEFSHCFGRSTVGLVCNEMQFFGPKSEYIICALYGNRILLQDKKTAAAIGCSLEELVFDVLFKGYSRRNMLVHPRLPVVATNFTNKISIWAPTRLKMDEEDETLPTSGYH